MSPARKPRRTAVDRLRAICLAYPEAVEVEQFGHPWWKAGKKSFCLFGYEGGQAGASFNLPLATQAALVEDPRFTRSHYIGHHGWTTMAFGRSIEWPLVEELVEVSYRKVALKRMLKALDPAE